MAEPCRTPTVVSAGAAPPRQGSADIGYSPMIRNCLENWDAPSNLKVFTQGDAA